LNAIEQVLKFIQRKEKKRKEKKRKEKKRKEKKRKEKKRTEKGKIKELIYLPVLSFRFLPCQPRVH